MIDSENKYRTCFEMARRIVQAYREQAPDGFDPQNSVVTVGVLAVGVGAAAYAASSSASAADDAASVPVPKYKPYTPTLAQYDPSAGVSGYTQNVNQYGGAAQNAANQENSYYQQSLQAVDPALKQNLSFASRNATNNLKGQISPDVAQSIARSTAQAGLTGGFGADSGQGRNLTARDFGETSLQLQQLGAQQAGQNASLAASLTPVSAAGILGTSGTYLSNYNNNQQFNANTQTEAARNNAQGFNQQAQQQYQQQVNQALAPDPAAAAALAGAGALSSASSSYYGKSLAGANAGANYYGVGNTGYNTNGFYATPMAANSAYGSGANLGYQPGVGGGYYNQGFYGPG